MCATHGRLAGCNTVEYATAFLFSVWLFKWHGIKMGCHCACSRSASARFYLYICQMYVHFGSQLQKKCLLLHFSAVPLEPANVEIFGIDSDELSVRWNSPEDATSFQIQKYLVEHRKFEDKLYTSASQPASDDKTQYTIRIQPLEPETTYMIRVGAVNDYGLNYNDESAHKTEATRKPVLFCFLFLYLFT